MNQTECYNIAVYTVNVFEINTYCDAQGITITYAKEQAKLHFKMMIDEAEKDFKANIKSKKDESLSIQSYLRNKILDYKQIINEIESL